MKYIKQPLKKIGNLSKNRVIVQWNQRHLKRWAFQVRLVLLFDDINYTIKTIGFPSQNCVNEPEPTKTVGIQAIILHGYPPFLWVWMQAILELFYSLVIPWWDFPSFLVLVRQFRSQISGCMLSGTVFFISNNKDYTFDD